MGCEFQFQRLTATTDEAAKRETEALIEHAKWEHGHGGYSGSLAEACGCVLDKTVLLESVEAASDWLNENAEKWGPAVIVKTQSGTYCVGANCSS